jgi:atypical dual specificity phosphatase
LGRTGKIYRRVRAKVIDKPTYFSWVIDGSLAASGLPSSRSQLRWLSKNGVDSILTLTESPLPIEWFDGLGVESKHISMVDHAPPNPEKLKEAADQIDSQMRAGKSVLVHCLAGIGRTGSSIAAYMIVYQGKTAKEAIEQLRKMRPGSVERAQEVAVYEFEKRFGADGAAMKRSENS